ncbi:hypothetical protein DYU11_05635 [Fibrisoma montanum]|uniref:Histidine kinase n=1 Tax=Fibrisoma montanum TaxID=2305895 RepID=A0A418MK10_9BACT|nr:two-component regulator propeller domain-containing protein [Fibrisoma montanum]RIV27777.1 hypothetical protein DYU11_05635 [Fibrisoma montanum]
MASGRIFFLVLVATYRLLMGCSVVAADGSLQFKHLTTADGLPNSTVLCFTQDKYGFIWMGTENGLCRYDGRSVKSYYYNRDQKNSIPHNRVTALYTDADGKVWIGTAHGLAQFDYEAQNFRRFPIPERTTVTSVSNAIVRRGRQAGGNISETINYICEATPGLLWLATLNGVWFFDKKKLSYTAPLRYQSLIQHLNSRWVNQIKTDKKGFIYLATSDGVKIVNSQTNTWREYRHILNNPQTISDGIVSALAPDDSGRVWVGIYSRRGFLERLTVQTGQVERITIEQFAGKQRTNTTTLINDLVVDQKGFVWAATSHFSLLQVNPVTLQATQYQQDPFSPSSLKGQSMETLFLDKEGQIWIGTGLAGVNWFKPARSLFTVFQESIMAQNSLPNSWARAAVEDREGNLWLATGKGVVVHKTGQGFIRRYTATGLSLPDYSTRSLARDSSGNIWVGTASGLHRFSAKTYQRHTLTEPNSNGGAFYWSLLVTPKGEVWAGASGGLRRYNPALDRLELLTNDSLYHPYANWSVRYVAHAADGGLWIGFLRDGLLYWHPEKKRIKHYSHVPGNSSSLVDNYITAITTDAAGLVWVATLSGLCALDLRTQQFQSYDHLFKPNAFGALLVDARNRLWLGTNDGLFCLERDRRTVYRFDQVDGLPTNEINDQRPYQLSDGRFCYATLQGFALFQPEVLLATSRSPAPVCYLTNFSIYNHPVTLRQNLEAVQQLSLKAEENFFTLEWTALHYENPEKCQYAYRLAGLDRDWVYTKTPVAQYTNVPGGDYEFEFRASLIPDRWDGPIRRIHVHVDTVFYRTWWFISMILLLIAATVTAVYQYRMRQTFRVARLQMRATRLEKDNALVQYQNLINQLNPHFLFNSLAVLDGLITKDAKLAAKYLNRMTKVYRYLIENDQIETVQLEKELRFVADFINLLTTRYGRGLQVEVDVPERLGGSKIVPVTLQNLIENAIKHNTTDDESPLRIRIYTENDYLIVENNLQKRSVVKNSNRKGLNDLKTLYGYLTDRPLTLLETDTSFTVQVPLLTE